MDHATGTSQQIEPEEERRLIIAAGRNNDAFRRLYDHYLPRVYAYVGYRIGPTGDVEDVVAEVFLKVSGGLRGFTWRGPGSFAAWLFRIAHNEVARHYRQIGAHAHDVSLETVSETHGGLSTAGTTLETLERTELIKKLLDELPPRKREVILLKFFGDLRNREIAHILNLDERTVASHLSRGLDEMRRLWSKAVVEKERER